MAAGASHMDCAEFVSLREARVWQRSHGGHLFLPERGDFVLWFNPRHTMGSVMRHPRWLAGLSGVFNPTD